MQAREMTKNKAEPVTSRKDEYTEEVNGFSLVFLPFSPKKNPSMDMASLGENKALILYIALSTAEDSDQ